MHRRHKQVPHSRTGLDVAQRFRNCIHAFIIETAMTLGFLWGLAQFVCRYLLPEFLITFAVIGWSLSSLVSAAELRGHAELLRAIEYLS